MTRPEDLGGLKASGWASVPVKEEMRRNLYKDMLQQMFQSMGA